ncbi:MAG: Cthe_2314 family HEPN domain-containing protein [Dehalococcoidia bacterium]|nr:Cthe_2314 family HEPN domain-containing protein [Dehalococcoidia bacterium]
MQIEEHPLVCRLCAEMRPRLESVTPEDLLIKSAKARHARTPKLTEEQNYNRYVFWYAWNLVESLRRLNNAKKYMGDFPKPKAYLKQEITQYDWIQYHYHMYIVSIFSLYDIALKLTNAVFRLGLPEREAKKNTVEENLWVKSTGTAELLKLLRQAIAQHAKERHSFIHEGDLIKLDEIDEEKLYELYLLELYCIALRENIEIPPAIPVEMLKNLSKPAVNGLLNKMSTEIASLETQIASLFDRLLPVYEFWASYLKRSKQNKGI